jgi:hypothetical protein
LEDTKSRPVLGSITPCKALNICCSVTAMNIS